MVHLKADHAFIGTVVAFVERHQFDDGSVRDAVLIKLAADQSTEWVPRTTVHQLYVTR